jgi:Flp pilus assembly protein TadD
LQTYRTLCGFGLLAISFAAIALHLSPGVKAASEHDDAVLARQSYNDKIVKTYNDRFKPGSHFLPSNMSTDTGAFVDPKTYPTAEYCGHCHQEAHQQWRESAHSNANRAPWYLRNVALLKAEKGVEATRHCEGCHDPLLVASGGITTGASTKRQVFDEDGVTCTVCHSIQKVDTRGTGSYVLGTPAVLLDESGLPITRSVSDDEIMAHLDRHSAAVMKPFYKSSEYCSTCHKAALPRELNDYKWQRAISLYDEWQNSSFAKQSPLPFYQQATASTCQRCHMEREDVKLSDPGAKHGQLASHRWLGANTIVPDYYHFPEQSKRVIGFLQNNALKIDIFAIEHGNGPSASSLADISAPLGRVAFRTEPRELVTADVIIQNKFAHSLVPEQRDMYQAWVEFTLTDSHGKVLRESGSIDNKTGALDERAQSFTNRLINTKSQVNREHQVWNTRVVAYNNTIQSGRSQIVRYTFRMPATDIGPITLTASVKYRRFNQHFIDFGMSMTRGKHYPQTVVTMATGSATINLGENSPTPPATAENPTWMRWNNYAIALLDAQQYDAAINAFAMVVKLRPDYADGFTNRALAELQWQKYAEARSDLAEALRLVPGNVRALYYRGLLQRTTGDLDAAVVDLRKVSSAFPRSRDAHRELGFTYSQMHRYQEAVAEYQAVQGIDPDDLSAHYNLAILYRRLGKNAEATAEAARFTDQKDDPAASVYALAYLRGNPSIANETIAWHAHDLDATFDRVKGDLPTTFSGTQQ